VQVMRRLSLSPLRILAWTHPVIKISPSHFAQRDQVRVNMKPRVPMLIILLTFGNVCVVAQSPNSIAGRTLQLTVTSGTFPFASSGSYRMLPSALDSRYAIVPMSGDIASSQGTYSYTKAGATTATLAISDDDSGPIQASCTFSSAGTGTYLLTSSLFPGGRQTGSFVIYSGQSPTSIAGRTLTVTITSGESPFAEIGSYRFVAAAAGNTYTVFGIAGVDNSNGTYSYTQNSPTTGLISFTDNQVGAGFSQQLSFDTTTSGSIYLRLAGSSAYQTAIFTMSTPVEAPSITVQPVSQAVSAGATVAFSVAATGTSPLSYQWRRNGVNISGATGPALTISNVSVENVGTYSVVVSNSAGTVMSANASLVLLEAPSILVHPLGLTNSSGANVTFSVTAAGSPPLSYQWRFNGNDIVGANGQTYTLNNIQGDQSGSYDVRVSNGAGATTSASATVLIWINATIRPVLLGPSGSTTNRLIRLSQLQPRAKYRVQFTPNFARWFELTTVVTEVDAADVSHATADLPKMFYRVVSP
jgi:hypothetical protein